MGVVVARQARAGRLESRRATVIQWMRRSQVARPPEGVKLLARFSGALAALGAVLVWATTVWGATVYLEPPELVMTAGESATVSVRVEGADSVSCFLVQLGFDPDVLQLTSAVEGSLFASSVHSTMFDWDQLAPGSHSVNDVLLGPGTYVLAPGELSTLVFTGVAPGSAAVELTTIDLRDVRREPIVPVQGLGAVAEVAEWSSAPSAPLPGRMRAEPNPATSRATLALPGYADSGGFVAVYDVRGREVRRLAHPRGAREIVWDLRDDCGAPVPGGVYFARTREPAAGVKITVVR